MVGVFSAAQVACGKIPANTPASGGPDMGMKKPQFSLPHDVPKLPPGMFYRVARDRAFTVPFYWVEVWEPGEWVSRAARAVRVHAESGDVVRALREACERAAAEAWELAKLRANWRELEKYVGDHVREDAK